MKTKRELTIYFAGQVAQVVLHKSGVNPNTIRDHADVIFQTAGALATEALRRCPEEPKKRMKTEDALFDSFWERFPKKKDKGAAQKAWKQMDASEKEAAIAQAEAYAQAYAQTPDNRRQYFKGPAPWLNAKCWNDDHAEWRLIIEGK